MKTLFILLTLIFSIQIIAQDLNSAFQVGGSGTDEGQFIEVDSENNTLVAGNFTQTVDFDPSSGVTNLTAISNDIFVAKYDENGNLIWAFNLETNSPIDNFTIDELGNFYVTSIFTANTDLDPGSPVVNPSSDSDGLFLAKYDKDANLIWHVTLGNEGDFSKAFGLDVNQNGEVLISGFFGDDFNLNDDSFFQGFSSVGNADMFIAKIDGTSGQFIWAHSIGTPAADRLLSLTTDVDDNIYLTGQIFESTDFDMSATVNNLELVGVAGNTFVVKWDTDANFIWSGAIGGNAVSAGNTITVDHNNDVLLSGGFGGVLDFDMGSGTSNQGGGASSSFINKFDSDGNFIWFNKYSEPINADNLFVIGKLSVDADNNIYQAGSFNQPISLPSSLGDITLNPLGMQDVIISKVNGATGDFIWGKQLGSPVYSEGANLALTPENKISVTGYFSGTIDADPGSGVFELTSNGNEDIFITTLNQSCPDFSAAITEVNEVTCIADGTATVAAIGGLAPYTFEWNTNPIATSATVNITSPGNYNVTVSDSLGCEHILGAVINGPNDNAFNQYDLADYVIANDFRTGFDANVWLNVFNKNCEATDGQVKLVASSELSFVSSTNAPDLINGDTLIWNFSNLAFDIAAFTAPLVFNVSPLSAIGDTVSLQLIVEPTDEDADPSNNIKTYFYPIINSYDPNDKNVYPARCEENYILNGEPLTYTVRFQNTGNAEAININILDTLDVNLDIQTLRVVGNSHPMITEIQNENTLNFKFPNILLPDSTSNEPASNGYVIFEINPKPNLPIGTTIKNTANIYFDFNEAIVTNTIGNTITDELPNCTPFIATKITTLEKLEFEIYPNPTTGIVQLFFQKELKDRSVRIFNLQGELIYFLKNEHAVAQEELNLGAFPKGIYFIEIKNGEYLGWSKVVKME